MPVILNWRIYFMYSIDLNCDMGEGAGNDAAILPYVSSVNIACGYHAGDERTMFETMRLAKEHGVSIGAHVSYFDRENFGRTNMIIPHEDVYEIVEQQLLIFYTIADALDVDVHHVKPHGALYNMATDDPELANVIARAIKDVDHDLVMVGLSNSCMVSEARAVGLSVANEVFADRSYQDNGRLTPRSEPHALITETDAALQQVLQLVKHGTVTSVSGEKISLKADTICIHGDGLFAVEFAKHIHQLLKRELVEIKHF
jgi:UPF0271 protein